MTVRAPGPSRASVARPGRLAAIMEDAGDPHLLANLRKLGAVKVDHHMQTVKVCSCEYFSLSTRLTFALSLPLQASDGTAKMLQTRLEADEEAASFTLNRNHLFSYALTQLLRSARRHPSLCLPRSTTSTRRR